MFKRVEKRLQKQAKEEELGLTEEMKDVLGMHDTDSDESNSDSEDAMSGDDSEEEEALEDAASEEGNGDAVEEEDDDEDEESEGDIKPPPISVTDAMKDPVYFVSPQSDDQACAVCPGKVLKNAQMGDAHRASQVRRTFSEGE